MIYIEENLYQSPEDIFNQLVSRRDMENLTQSQIYYHWHKATVRLYRRSLDQIESTVRVIEEQPNIDLLYFDEDHPRAIAFTTCIGSEVLRLQPPQ